MLTLHDVFYVIYLLPFLIFTNLILIVTEISDVMFHNFHNALLRFYVFCSVFYYY